MAWKEREILHSRAVKGLAILVVLTVIAVGVTQILGVGQRYVPSGQPVATAELMFEDREGGVVIVTEARSGAVVMEYGENEGVFVRSVMRTVARQRRMRGYGRDIPVALSEHSDGKLWLTDAASGIEIYLGAFGADNQGAFADLLARNTALASTGGTDGEVS